MCFQLGVWMCYQFKQYHSLVMLTSCQNSLVMICEHQLNSIATHDGKAILCARNHTI